MKPESPSCAYMQHEEIDVDHTGSLTISRIFVTSLNANMTVLLFRSDLITFMQKPLYQSNII